MAHKFPTTRWRIEDVLDLEYFFQADKESGCDKETLKQRDRSIFSKIQADFAGKGDLTTENTKEARSYLIKNWLEIRRGKPGDKQLPGGFFHSTLTLLKWALAILGALSGMGLALSLLQYDGKLPINIAYSIGWLIVLQLVIVIMVLIFNSWNKFPARFFTSLLWDYLGKLLLSLKPGMSKAAERIPFELRERMYARCGQLKIQSSIYGDLFLLTISPIVLLFGLCFNIAALVVILIKLCFTDVAFGWQSTLLMPSQIHGLVKLIALPWSWMKIGVPTLEQIEKSHIILKDGGFDLQTPDLVSWAYFLCLGLFFHGVLLRILFWLHSLWKQHSALARLDFSHADCRELLSRMRIPQDDPPPRTGAPGEENETETDAQIKTGEQTTPADVKGDIPSPEKENGEEAVVLLEEDLAADVSSDAIQTRGRQLFQLEVRKILRVGGSFKRERESLEQLQQWQWHSNGAVLLILSAWQPPIEEKLALLRKLRSLLPEHGRIILYLIGKPQLDNIFTPPKPTDYDIWKQRTLALGDPWLEITACE